MRSIKRKKMSLVTVTGLRPNCVAAAAERRDATASSCLLRHDRRGFTCNVGGKVTYSQCALIGWHLIYKLCIVHRRSFESLDNMQHALIIGDSFVSRLHRRVNSSGLRLRSWTVSLHGVSGGDVRRLCAWVQQQVGRPYDVVIVHLGSNDLCHSGDHNSLVQGLMDLASYLMDHWGVAQVVISEVFLRWRNGRHMHITLQQYNSAVCRANAMLLYQCSQRDRLTLWQHRRLQNRRLFCQDGVHFNSTGEERFFRSIRGAVLSSRSQF